MVIKWASAFCACGFALILWMRLCFAVLCCAVLGLASLCFALLCFVLRSQARCRAHEVQDVYRAFSWRLDGLRAFVISHALSRIPFVPLSLCPLHPYYHAQKPSAVCVCVCVCARARARARVYCRELANHVKIATPVPYKQATFISAELERDET
jgi:hypothetical protein